MWARGATCHWRPNQVTSAAPERLEDTPVFKVTSTPRSRAVVWLMISDQPPRQLRERLPPGEWKSVCSPVGTPSVAGYQPWSMYTGASPIWASPRLERLAASVLGERDRKYRWRHGMAVLVAKPHGLSGVILFPRCMSVQNWSCSSPSYTLLWGWSVPFSVMLVTPLIVGITGYRSARPNNDDLLSVGLLTWASAKYIFHPVLSNLRWNDCRKKGKPIKAIINGAPPIFTYLLTFTSLAFILGVLPLVIDLMVPVLARKNAVGYRRDDGIFASNMAIYFVPILRCSGISFARFKA